MKYKIYTDGACSVNPGPGGWGAVIFDEKEKQYNLQFQPVPMKSQIQLRNYFLLRLASKRRFSLTLLASLPIRSLR